MIEDNKEFVRSLRLVADLYENNPDFPLPVVSEFSIYSCDDKEELKRLIRILGNVEKDFSYDIACLTKKFGCLSIVLKPYRETICKRKVIGEKIVTKQIPTAFTAREEKVDIVEWECEPIMG